MWSLLSESESVQVFYRLFMYAVGVPVIKTGGLGSQLPV